MLRGQILIAIKTEISDSIDTAPSEVEVEQTQTINEVSSYIINELIDNMHVILKLLEKSVNIFHDLKVGIDIKATSSL